MAALFRDTDDFEQVLALLRERLGDDQASPQDHEIWRQQEDQVRTGFIDVLQRVHPEHSLKMDDEEKERCATFLEHFVGRARGLKLAGRVYTTNYDLLLYWVVVKFGRRLWCYDSHISPDPNAAKRYGLWTSDKIPELLYLHRALHLYDIPPEGQGMLRYSGQQNLIEQARKRLTQGSFPVIVSEGTTDAKAARIARSAYLTWASGFFRLGLRNRRAVLFTFGHSLDERDAHLIGRIGTGRISTVYVGARGGMAGHQAEIASSHHWARELIALGHEVKLMPAQYVKPYVKRSKNDAADAEAICEAVRRPTMRFVAIKSPEQQCAMSGRPRTARKLT